MSKTRIASINQRYQRLAADEKKPSGEGWEKIKGGEHGGYSRIGPGGRTQYWYPSVKHAEDAVKHHKKQSAFFRKTLSNFDDEPYIKKGQERMIKDHDSHAEGAGEFVKKRSRKKTSDA